MKVRPTRNAAADDGSSDEDAPNVSKMDIGIPSGRRESATRALPLRGEFDFDDKDGRYGGTKVSRSSWTNAEVESDSDSSSVGETDASDDKNTSGVDEVISEGDISEVGSEDEDQDEISEDEGDMASRDEDQLAAPAQRGEEEEAVDAELEDLLKEEKRQVSHLAERKSQEIEKGKHVKNQYDIWKQLLGTRIRMQGPLGIASRLPVEAARDLLVEGAEEGHAQLRRGVKGGLAEDIRKAEQISLDVVRDFLHASSQLLAGQSEISGSLEGLEKVTAIDLEKKEDGSSRVSDKDLDRVWKCVRSAHDRFVPYCDATLDSWHQRTVLASQTLAARKFKSFNKTLSEQVRAAWGDLPRLVRRTQVARGTGNGTVLGKRLLRSEETPQAGGADAEEVLYNPEIYDDADFYQQQLKEVVEAGRAGGVGGGGGAAGGFGMTQRALAVREQLRRKKRAVDTRASKGRKIRYKEMPKLVNFMAPVPLTLPDMAPGLFSSLFGGKAS